MNKFFQYCILFIISLNAVYSQECLKFERKGNCILSQRIGFKIYRESTNMQIYVNKKVEFKLTLLGNREYVITLCTNDVFYPIHYRIIDHDEGKVLYDNETDDYIESVGFGLDNTRNLIIEATALAKKSRFEDRVYPQCLGLYIQYRFP